MDINFKGLVDLHNLPTSEPLLPLFEAIVNSVQSINQGKVKDGQITIYIEREKNKNFLKCGEWETDIENIIVTDNGIGFTDENYESFNTYASDFKKMLGCKGVGRMIWLKAFNHVEIESIYEQNGQYKKRSFNFDSVNAVNMKKDEILNEEKSNLTIIRLLGLRSKNKLNTPKKLTTIAKNILNHCFIYFVLDIAPRIVIKDDEESILINDLYNNIGKENISSQ